jgi:hypothetical protein
MEDVFEASNPRREGVGVMGREEALTRVASDEEGGWKWKEEYGDLTNF